MPCSLLPTLLLQILIVGYTPGPANIYSLAMSLRHGRRASKRTQTIYKMNRLLTILVVFLPLLATAQEEGGFTADRPGATTGVDVLPQGRVQWETGMSWERSKLDEPTTTSVAGTTMLRWGFSQTAELRLQADYLYASADGYHDSGLSNVSIGTKVRLYEGMKAVPAVSLLAHVLVPGGGDATFLPQEWGGQLGLLFQNQLTSSLSLGYEGDLIWSDDSRPVAFFGLCLGATLSDRLSLAVEEYNYNTSDGTECWSEVALAWQLSPRLQLDLATDIHLQHPGRYHNVLFGVAWQITK